MGGVWSHPDTVTGPQQSHVRDRGRPAPNFGSHADMADLTTGIGLLGAGDDPQREDLEKDPDRRSAPWYNRCRIAAGRSGPLSGSLGGEKGRH